MKWIILAAILWVVLFLICAGPDDAEAKPKAKTAPVPAVQVEDIMWFNCYKVRDGGVCDVHTNRKEANGFLPLIRLKLRGACEYQRECTNPQEGMFCQGSFVCPDEVLPNDLPPLRTEEPNPPTTKKCSDIFSCLKFK